MTLAHAARLLAAARTLDALARLARAAGVTGPLDPLPRPARELLGAAVGAPGVIARARVAAGPAPLHALVADLAGPPLRDAASRLAAHLAAATPHHLWLLVLRHTGDGSCLVAAWPAATHAPRLAALRFHPDAVTPSDADTLRALAARAAASVAPLLTHAAWLDALGRDALGNRFYRTLERTVAALADSLPPSVPDPAARADLALLTATRLLFLAFLEAKSWLDGDPAFLTRHYDASMARGGRFHARTLRPLFFGTLNTPRRHRAPAARAFGRIPFLNGGLFAPTPLERRHPAAHCGDAALGALVHTVLAAHRFTAHEHAAAWSEAAVDPEMLGRAFESLMSARERHTTGAVYTPRPLVEHATTEALRYALATPDPPAGAAPDRDAPDLAAIDRALAGEPPPPPVARWLHARASALRLLDPACGSGAFLVHALERLADLLATCGDARPVADRRQAVLTRSIFGVDVNPTAVWLCELRLWLSVVVERDAPDPHAVPPLPNLDHNVRVGDALAVPPGLEPLTRHTWGGAPWGAPGGTIAARGVRPPARSPSPPPLAALRARYVTLAGPRKVAAARRLDAAERAHALAALDAAVARLRHARADALTAARAPDLFGHRHRPSVDARGRLAGLRAALRTLAARRRAVAGGGALPFGFAWHFADAADAGGFDLLLGNPPWVRPHALPADARGPLRAHYASARPAPARAHGPPQAVPNASIGGPPGESPDGVPEAGPPPDPARAAGFGTQVDLAALFTERALALTRPGGVTAFLVPAKLWRTLAGGALRALVLRESTPLALDDWSDAPNDFAAAVYPSLLVTRRHSDERPPADPPATTVRVHRARTHSTAAVAPRALPLDPASPAAPWLLLPPDVRAAFDALRAAGPPLARTALPRPTLGVKCGLNEAFLVAVDGTDGDLARVRQGDRTGLVERTLLRPALRGEHLARAARHAAAGAEHLLWTHDDASGRPLAALPPHAARWLAPWRPRLAARTDLRGAAAPWWTLFRTDGASPARPRVAWPDLARAPHPRLLPAGDPHVPLNTCYAATFDDEHDARAFAALLASPPVAAWLGALAEPARGGYRRFLAWTVALLPIPRDWPTARRILAPFTPDTSPALLTEAVARAYRLPPSTLTPLLDHAPIPAPAPPSPAPPPRLIREPAWPLRRTRR